MKTPLFLLKEMERTIEEKYFSDDDEDYQYEDRHEVC